jgi:hypothetical protein
MVSHELLDFALGGMRLEWNIMKQSSSIDNQIFFTCIISYKVVKSEVGMLHLKK